MDESSLNNSCTLNDLSNANFTRREHMSVLERNEILIQENFELKKKVELSEKLKQELEFDVVTCNNTIVKDQSTIFELRKELEVSNAKAMEMESLNAEEKLNSEKIKNDLMVLSKMADKKCPKCSLVKMEEDQQDAFTEKVKQLQSKIDADEQVVENLLDENKLAKENNIKLQNRLKEYEEELNEVKELLRQKSTEINELKEGIESLKEEKMLLFADLQMCKASDSNAARGNSLFAEVEENRQKMAAQRENLKLKYIHLKKLLNQKTIENNKLKMEIVKIRREEKDEENNIQKDYSNLIAAYKERQIQLEERASHLEKNIQVLLNGSQVGENLQFQWVNSMIELSRAQSEELRAELDKKSSDYVTQAHLLFNSQKENRKLKSFISQLKSDTESLKLELDKLKTVKSDDGMSPEATDLAMKLQKQKVVKFKEELDVEQQIPEK